VGSQYQVKEGVTSRSLRKAIVKKLKRWKNMSPCGKPED